MSLLAEEISKLTNPLPEFEDPEDTKDETAAKLLSHVDDDDDDEIGQTVSKLRSRAAVLQEDDDVKYSGRRVSRKSLIDEEDSDQNTNNLESEPSSESEDIILTDDVDDDDDDVDDDDDDDVIQSEEEEEQLDGFKEKLKFQDNSQDVDLSEDDEVSSEGSSDEEEDGDEEEGDLQNFTKVNVEEEIQKGRSVRAQLSIWDSLLEDRIKLQKVLLIVNQLPQPDVWHHFLDTTDPGYSKALAENESTLQKLLDQLIQLQTTLLLQNPDTKQLVDAGKQSNVYKKSTQLDVEEADEEITSDSEFEDNTESRSLLAPSQGVKRKLKPGQYPEFLAKRHKAFEQFRNATIQKWYDKTRIATGRLGKGFSAFDQSAVRQIEQILSDKERLIKRTQLKRSAYRVLGKPELDEQKTKPDEDNGEKESLPIRSHLHDYDEEIFDDDDFYHQQLRELIERKTADISDPVAITRQWLEIQKLRNKKKKVVDTKASKGRKIRYDVHKKLVNFMAPFDNLVWNDKAKDELYRSLFGKHLVNTEQSIK